jgi:hypothetical protein
VSGTEIVMAYCVGAAALALWIVARFPKLGPRDWTGVIAVAVAAALVLALGAPLFGVVIGVGRYGVAIGLLTIVLPTLTAAFWACACVLRMIAEQIPRI